MAVIAVLHLVQAPTTEGGKEDEALLPSPPHDSKGVYMDNNMKFNQMLNSSPYGRQIYDLLLLVASKPAVKQTKDIGEKRQVIIREIISILNEPQSSQQAV